MDPKELLLLVACLGLLGELRLTSTTTTTTFVAAMSIANQDLERYFRTTNASQTLATMTEERIAMDMYTYAYLNYTYLDEQQQLVVKAFNDEKARYGEGKVLSVRGKLVHITDMIDGPEGRIEGGDFACTSNILGTRGEPIPAAGVSWIALVRRGRCTFEEKVMHVHAKGAAGVIIYNDKSSVNLEKMQIKGKSRNITAVITHQEIGQDMARIVDQGADMMAAIIEGRSGMRPIHSMNRTSVLFVSISFIVLMIISLVWLVFYYIQRFRYLQSKDQQSRHLCSVTKKAIMKIPTKTGKISDEKDADSDCCAICIETYKPSDCIRVLPCKHEFHKNCIDPWLIEHRTCPMCKLDVLKFYGYVFLGSEESILEYEAERMASIATAAAAMSAAPPTAAVSETQPRLSDLIRSRDFVIDFPRVFVLDAGSAAEPRETLFPERMPERSQSTLSLAQAKDWMTQVSNKLEEQHGLRRLRKNSGRYEMEENLLGVRCDSTKKRRSHSAEGRYSQGAFDRRAAAAQQAADEDAAAAEAAAEVCFPSSAAVTRRNSRRNSSALRVLTDASYAQSIQRRRQELQARRRVSGVPMPGESLGQRRTSAAIERGGDVAIQIQVNGEGVDF